MPRATPIDLDAISALQKDDSFRDLLKSICETGKRVVYWAATAATGLSSRASSSTSWIVLAGTALILATIDPPGLSIRIRSTHCRRAQSFS